MRVQGTTAVLAVLAALLWSGGAAAVEGPLPQPDGPVVERPVEPPMEEPAADVPADLPIIERDVSRLPTPVRRLREQIIAAASTGDVAALSPIFEANGPLQLGEEGNPEDPVAQLKSLSGDPEGREILAVLIEVFEAGYLHVDAGTPEEMYLWPYFARYPVEALTPPQLVELFKIVFAGDYVEMQAYGFYTWFRAGITPDGTWVMFTTD